MRQILLIPAIIIMAIVPVQAGGHYISAATGLKNLPDNGIEFVPFIVVGQTPDAAKAGAIAACQDAQLNSCMEELSTIKKCIYSYKGASIEKDPTTGEKRKVIKVFMADSLEEAGDRYVAIMNSVPTINDLTRFCN